MTRMTPPEAESCWREFLAELNELVVLGSLAPSAISRFVGQVGQNPDARLIVGSGNPNDPASVRFGSLLKSELLELVTPPNSPADRLFR